MKPRVDPFGLVAEELKSVSERLRRTILTDIPILSTAAEYFFKASSWSCRMLWYQRIVVACTFQSRKIMTYKPAPEEIWQSYCGLIYNLIAPR